MNDSFVAIPLEQGLFFNKKETTMTIYAQVAIPLEQGLFFNASPAVIQRKSKSRNPFGAGTIF